MLVVSEVKPNLPKPQAPSPLRIHQNTETILLLASRCTFFVDVSWYFVVWYTRRTSKTNHPTHKRYHTGNRPTSHTTRMCFSSEKRLHTSRDIGQRCIMDALLIRSSWCTDAVAQRCTEAATLASSWPVRASRLPAYKSHPVVCCLRGIVEKRSKPRLKAVEKGWQHRYLVRHFDVNISEAYCSK